MADPSPATICNLRNPNEIDSQDPAVFLSEDALKWKDEIEKRIRLDLKRDFSTKYSATNRPKLATFNVTDEGLLGSYAHSLKLPAFPGVKTPRPSLLLHGLATDVEEHKKSEVYEYLDMVAREGPGSLYGTSGAG